MDFIINIFWNREERRFRAFWRLGVQMGAWYIGQFILQAIIGIGIGVTLAASGALSVEQLSDPAQVMDVITGSPLILLLLQFTTLIVTLLTVWLAGRFLDRRKFTDFGLRLNGTWLRDLGFGLFLGAFLMVLIFGIELAAGWITVTGAFVSNISSLPFLLAILAPAIMFLIVGFQEELFSRGYQLTNFAEGLNGRIFGPRGAIIIAAILSSVIFGLLHANNPNATALSTFNIFLAGIFLGMGYLLTGDLAIPIGLHITWNFFQGNVFGFPVSGTAANAVTFIGIEQGGPNLWTGGAFGPEAGLVGIGAMLLGSLLIILYVRLTRGKAVLHRPIAETPEKPGALFRKRETTASPVEASDPS